MHTQLKQFNFTRISNNVTTFEFRLTTFEFTMFSKEKVERFGFACFGRETEFLPESILLL